MFCFNFTITIARRCWPASCTLFYTPKGATSSTCSSDPGWPSPNLTLLNHALAQTGWRGPTLTDENWRAVLHERLQNVSWLGVVDDVSPFLP
jgi:hypothetical protein